MPEYSFRDVRGGKRKLVIGPSASFMATDR
jgi:hypothetical protein